MLNVRLFLLLSPSDDTTVLPSSPLFLSLTDSGILCPYTIINIGCSSDKIIELMSLPQPLPRGPVRRQTSVPLSISTQQANAPALQTSYPPLTGLSHGSAPPMPTLGLKSNPTTGVGQGTPIGVSVGAHKPLIGTGLGYKQPSLTFGAGNINQSTTMPGLTTTSATAGNGAQFPFTAGLNTTSQSTPPVPSSGGGGLSFSHQNNTFQAPATAAIQQSLGFSQTNIGGAGTSVFAKPSTIPPISETTKGLPVTSALSTTKPPSFFSPTTVPDNSLSLAHNLATNKPPTGVVSTTRPTSAVPALGQTSHVASTQSGLGQKLPVGGLHKPQSTYTPPNVLSQPAAPVTRQLPQAAQQPTSGTGPSRAQPLVHGPPTQAPRNATNVTDRAEVSESCAIP